MEQAWTWCGDALPIYLALSPCQYAVFSLDLISEKFKQKLFLEGFYVEYR